MYIKQTAPKNIIASKLGACEHFVLDRFHASNNSTLHESPSVQWLGNISWSTWRPHCQLGDPTSSTCRPNPLIGGLVFLFPPWTCCFQKRSRGSFYKTNRCGRSTTLGLQMWGGRIMGRFGRFLVRLAVGRRPGRLVIWGLRPKENPTKNEGQEGPKTWRNWTKNLETYPEKHSPQLQKNPCPHTVDGSEIKQPSEMYPPWN